MASHVRHGPRRTTATMPRAPHAHDSSHAMTLGVAQLAPARRCPVLENPTSQAPPPFFPWPLFASEDGNLPHSHYRRYCVTAFLLFLFVNGAPFTLIKLSPLTAARLRRGKVLTVTVIGFDKLLEVSISIFSLLVLGGSTRYPARPGSLSSTNLRVVRYIDTISASIISESVALGLYLFTMRALLAILAVINMKD